jgi:asparagine N-glycosylation enzyme membrane subunit Stt3
MERLKKLSRYWWVLVLALIFLFAYQIRSVNTVPDRLLSFDPIFQYRHTYYFANWGRMPLWDELTYYVGRTSPMNLVPPFMFYVTSVVYWLLEGFGYSLMSVAAHMGAIYGAMITIAAFLLARELSNKYGGLMAAALIATAPQILIRTFGSSYDTDQIVLFFMILTVYLGIRALRRRTIESICSAIIGFTAFMISWFMFSFSFLIIAATILTYFVLASLLGNKLWEQGKKMNISERIGFSFKDIKPYLKVLGVIFVGLLITISVVTKFDLDVNLLHAISAVVSFARNPEVWIVNISIAELQPFDIFNINGWILAMGRFSLNDVLIDTAILIIFIFMMLFGIIYNYRKDLFLTSVLLTLFLMSVVITTRGIRFTEFSSAFFIVLVSAGFGSFVKWSRRDDFLKAFSIGLGLVIIFIAMGLGQQVGQTLGPDVNPNWDNAWEFIKTQTPESSLIGTWWDPGHMIAGLAERRNIGDGAHCGPQCLYTINDRIADLGKIMATNDENESINLIRKYQGTSEKVYWIASDDLIGKFQWCQYFGTGCDARYDPSCPLYMQLGLESASQDQDGNIVLRKYGTVYVYEGSIPIPIFIQGINGAVFDEIIFYSADGTVQAMKLDEQQKADIITAIKPLERQMNFRFVNETIKLAVWVPQHRSYIALIPEHQRNNVFTKMFFLEGQGLDHFTQVFRNEQVKIYEVI